MKRVSTDTIIDLTGNSSQEDEPEIKKKKVEENELENQQKKDETVKEGAAEGTSIDLTNTDDEETDEDIKNANFSCRKCEFSCDTLNEYQTHNYTNHNNESGDV